MQPTRIDTLIPGQGAAPPQDPTLVSTRAETSAETGTETSAGPPADALATADSGVRFGVLALQASLMEPGQFAEACAVWAAGRGRSLADAVRERAGLTPQDELAVRHLLSRGTAPPQAAPQPAPPSQSPPHFDPAAQAAPPAAGRLEAASLLDGCPVPRDRFEPPAERFDAKAPAVPTPAADPERITLDGVHATGGIGRVWRAKDNRLKRDVAFKELRPDRVGKEATRARFFREAQITAELTHPGAVPVYDYVEEGERQYYTMPFVEGRTLSEVIRGHHEAVAAGESRTAGLMRLLDHFKAVCNTISYAHDRRIVHRDLKGENVLVGEYGEVVVLDWGLAKRMDAPPDTVNTMVGEEEPEDSDVKTMEGEALGTPAYMAPEQASGRLADIDERTDVYGLAAILYDILTGRPPFTGPVAQVLVEVCTKPPAPPRDVDPEVPEGLEAICLRGLSKKPGDRQPSAAALREEVEAWLLSQAERRQNERIRERFFSLSLDLLGIVDFEGRFVETNPAWERTLDWTATELSRKTLWDVIHPDAHDEFRAAVEGLRGGEPVAGLEFQCLCKGGDYRWVSWNAAHLAEEDAVYLVGRDIEALRRERAKFEGVLEAAPDAIVITDRARRIRLVNRQTEVLFGRPRGDLVGQPIEELVPTRLRDGHPAKFDSYAKCPMTRPLGTGLTLHGQHADGSEFPVEISLSPLQTEDGMSFIAVVRPLRERSTDSVV